jgi:hypothetical protein
MTSPHVRNTIIDQAQQERMARDTMIMQKVNKTHREAFKTRFPGQVEHCMRLTAERLQAILTRKPSDLADPGTWAATPSEIEDLVTSLYLLCNINASFPVEQEDEL